MTFGLAGVALLACGGIGFAICRARGFTWSFALGLLVPVFFVANTGFQVWRSDSLSEALTLTPQALYSVGLARGYTVAWFTKRPESGITLESAAPVEQAHQPDAQKRVAASR